MGRAAPVRSNHDDKEPRQSDSAGRGRKAEGGMLAGELDCGLRPDGLRCTIRFPLHRATEPAKLL